MVPKEDLGLGEKYPMSELNDADRTRDRILLESTYLFARQGYSTVSVRDIARHVNMKPASLYNHFISKEALWEAVLEHAKALYLQYLQRLKAATLKAGSFEEMLDCMFVELHSVVHIFTYYSFSLVQAEQFRDEKAHEIYRDIILRDSIAFIKGQFDRAIEQGWARAFDTSSVAISFMHCVLAGITMRVQLDMGRTVAYDVDKMFDDLHRHILQVATGG